MKAPKPILLPLSNSRASNPLTETRSLEFREMLLNNELDLLNKRLGGQHQPRTCTSKNDRSREADNCGPRRDWTGSFAGELSAASTPSTGSGLHRVKRSPPKRALERFLTPAASCSCSGSPEKGEIEVNLSNCRVLAMDDIRRQLAAACPRKEKPIVDKAEMQWRIEREQEEKARMLAAWEEEKVLSLA